MKFHVIKSSGDGFCPTGRPIPLGDVLYTVRHSKGYDSVEAMHEAIRAWAKDAKPGSFFYTRVTVIVAAGYDGPSQASGCPECESSNVKYDEFTADEDDWVLQDGRCCDCHARWRDVFGMVERQKLA